MEFIKSSGYVFNLSCARNVLIATSLRNFGGMVIDAFLPVFFGRNFPEYKPEYAFLNAICISGVGLISCLFGGALADKYEKNSYLTKAYICIIGCALSVPFVAIGTLDTDNFYLSFICYVLQVLVSGTYSGPAITMMQNTSPANQ